MRRHAPRRSLALGNTRCSAVALHDVAGIRAWVRRPGTDRMTRKNTPTVELDPAISNTSARRAYSLLHCPEKPRARYRPPGKPRARPHASARPDCCASRMYWGRGVWGYDWERGMAPDRPQVCSRAGRCRYTWPGSNWRPSACEAGVAPGAGWRGVWPACCPSNTHPGRLELPTLRLTASRSNQLSYGSVSFGKTPLGNVISLRNFQTKF